jgi:diguanylate cyclase (GGDEF)-like protein
VLYLDSDDFKGINDRYGHAAGDAVLVAVGQRLRGCLREGDSVARLGGDEFAVLVNALRAPEDAVRIAEHILNAMATLCVWRMAPPSSRHSASAWPCTRCARNGTALLHAADAAMYGAKRQSGATWHSAESAPPEPSQGADHESAQQTPPRFPADHTGRSGRAGAVRLRQPRHKLTPAQIAVLKNQGFMLTGNGWELVMPDKVLFGFDDDTVSAEQQNALPGLRARCGMPASTPCAWTATPTTSARSSTTSSSPCAVPRLWRACCSPADSHAIISMCADSARPAPSPTTARRWAARRTAAWRSLSRSNRPCSEETL